MTNLIKQKDIIPLNITKFHVSESNFFRVSCRKFLQPKISYKNFWTTSLYHISIRWQSQFVTTEIQANDPKETSNPGKESSFFAASSLGRRRKILILMSFGKPEIWFPTPLPIELLTICWSEIMVANNKINVITILYKQSRDMSSGYPKTSGLVHLKPLK